MVSYRRGDHTAGCAIFGQKCKIGTGRFYGYYRCIQPMWHNRPAKWSNSVKKMQNKGYYAVQGHQNWYQWKPVCHFLVINSNWHPISYHFGNIAAYFSNLRTLCIFLSHPLGSLGTMYDVHLGLIGKSAVDFLLVLIELFSLGVTAEALRAK